MKKAFFIPLVLLSFSLIIAIIGFLCGGEDAVWQKAITICLECIGIG